jgi:UDP-perosamine 4-acetyltransferase
VNNAVVVLGAGGHAKVVIEILEGIPGLSVHGCTSAEPGALPVLGYPVLGADDILPGLFNSGVRHAFVAVGDNRARLRAMREVTSLGFTLVQAVSPRAIVSARIRIGLGVAIMPGAVVNPDSELGDGAIVNTGATVDHDCRVGECAHIAPGVNLAGNVTIGTGAFVGIGSRVIPGRSIGEWAVVGAGTVVIRDVPPGVTVAGVPAVPLAPR